MGKIRTSLVVSLLLGCSCFALANDVYAYRYGRFTAARGHSFGGAWLRERDKCFSLDANGAVERFKWADCNTADEVWVMHIPLESRSTVQTANVWVDVVSTTVNGVPLGVDLTVISYYKDGTNYSAVTIPGALTGEHFLALSAPPDGSITAWATLRANQKVASFAWVYDW